MNSDFIDLLRLFDAHEVHYLVVGGYAVSHHAQPRFTKDLDLWIEPSAQNAARVASALREFGIPLIEVTEADFAQEGLQFAIGMPPSQLDFLTTIPGLAFAACWPSRNLVDIAGVSVPYLSKADLIVAKKTSGRAQDLADLEELQRSNDDP
jgi:hypothetical protein